MLNREFPILLDDSLTRAAVLAAILGAFVHQFLDWTVLGWAVIIVGLLMLWLAHQIAIAPCCDEPESADPSR
jgi:predicted MFS family arabinose efflux permease